MRWSIAHGMVVRSWGEGIELIWIHGLGEQSTSFDAIAKHPRLAGWRHTLVDLPGYGRAAWPQTIAPGDTLAQTAELLASWIDERPSDDQNLPVMIGHSQGGVLALMVAERTAVRGVISIDGNLTRGDCVFSGRAVASSSADFEAHGFAAMRDDIYKEGLIERALRGYHAAMLMASPQVFWANARDLVAACNRGDLAERWAALRCPTLFVAGVPNGICEASRHELARIGARWVAIEPSGHWPFIDQPELFSTEVAEFLAAL